MIKVEIKTKKGDIHSFFVGRGDDFLSTLDKFLKMNKISLSDLLSFFVDCGKNEESVSCRVVKASVEAIKLTNNKK